MMKGQNIMPIRLLTLTELLALTEYQREYLSAHSFGHPITTADLAKAQCSHWACERDQRDHVGRLWHKVGF